MDFSRNKQQNKHKGAIKLCIFLIYLSCNAVAKHVVLVNCTVLPHNIFCVSLRIALQEVELRRIAATCNAIAQCFTPSATFLAIFEPCNLQAHVQIYHFALKRCGYIRGVFSLPRPKLSKVAENDCTV